MRIIIDGNEYEADEGERLGAILESFGIRAKEGCIIAVKKKVREESVETDLFEIETTRGRMILRVECGEFLERWRKSCQGYEGAGVRWTTKDAVVFGSTVFDAQPSMEPVSLGRYEVTLSLSGLSKENTLLVFSKRPHSASYYPPKGCAVLGRIVYGRHLVGLLRMGDRILSIKPVLETKELAKSLLKGEAGTLLEDGDRIFTKVEVELDYDSPVCGEQAYNVLNDGVIKVSSETSIYICYNERKVIALPVEKLGVRKRGSFTVRNSGENVGAAYIYKKEAPLAQSHTIVGKVVEGLELVDLAKEGDCLAVSVKPPRIDLLGKRIADVRASLNAMGVKLETEGAPADTDLGVIVEHEPQNSLEIYKSGIVRCKVISPESILKIRLYEDKAPNSVRYFRAVTGLERKAFGKLKVYFATPKMEMILFKGNEEIAKGLTPENTPTGNVVSGSIGVTNTVKKFAGMIGIRMTDSDRFGPTAESFDGTNLIGEVEGGINLLRRLKEGSEMYVQELRG
ncbi:MAG: methanogenesis marker 3 protein [Candidatus Methanosuratincola petrocarbonis]|nr:methanogenesis marker 3 protein [Candidatus Methanosuratincola sp.]